MKSRKGRSKKSNRNEARKGEVAGELRDTGGNTNTAPYPAKAEASMRIVWFSNPKRIDPFPSRYRTVLTCAIRGNITAGNSALNHIIKLNSPRLPFNASVWPGALPSVATLQSTGYTALCNITMYQSFRVYGSRVMIEVAPVADVDIMVCTLTPSLSGSNPPNTAIAMAQPYTITKLIQRGQPASSCRLTNKMDCATLLGVTQRALHDDMSGQQTGTTGADPTDTNYWIFNIVREDGGATNSAIGYRVIVQYDVEFFGDGSALNPETIAQMEAIAKPLAHPPKSYAEVALATQPCPLDSPWGNVAPSKFLEAYMAAREAEKKNAK